MGGSWIEIDRARLLQNLRVFRERLGTDRLLMAVVKANAYGHGAALVARAIREHVDWLAVDSLAEARELAGAGVEAPILILGHSEPDEAEAIVEDGFRQGLFRRDVARALSTAAKRRSRIARVHLKVETGLYRLGIRPEALDDWCLYLEGLGGVEVEGAYTHFADVEDPESSFFRTQLERLQEAVGVVKSHGFRPSLIHAAPSAGVLLHDQEELTLGRVGIGLYGIWPSEKTRRAAAHSAPAPALVPVLSWKSRLAQVKAVPEGATVGYDLTYRAPSERLIGVLPVGYYDGYDRKLSNRGQVLVRGRRAPVVGRVAMNMTMVDVTEAGAREGDEVALIGDQGDERITADDLARWTGTISYEIVARLNPLLARRLR